MVTNARDVAQLRARRLLSLRGMSGLSRDLIHKRYGIAKATLQNWESARAGGLTRKGAQRILKAYHAEGVICTMDWLIDGVGTGPQLSANSPQSPDRTQHGHLPRLADDIAHLRALYEQLADMPIDDLSMHPSYPRYAHVAGVSYFCDQVQLTVGRDCIVHAVGYPPLFRRVVPANTVGLYHLVPLNLSGEYPIITDVEILSAAPVLWVRAEAFTYQPA